MNAIAMPAAALWARRQWLLCAAAIGASGLAMGALPQAIAIQVWKDPQCGCCQDWIVHLEQNSFAPRVFDEGNNAARSRLGMPKRYGSCHTALVLGYVIEGHVPASDIRRLLQQKPSALGLAVPGMPIGSPGMNGPAYGGRRDPYQVQLVRKDGTAEVFTSYP